MDRPDIPEALGRCTSEERAHIVRRGPARLKGAGQLRYLRDLLMCLDFIEAKIQLCGIDACLADYQLQVAGQLDPSTTDLGINEVEADLSPIRQVLEREAHHLRVAADADLLAQQLTIQSAALDSESRIARDVRQRLEELARPYLTLRWRTGGDGGALIRPLTVDTKAGSTVTSVMAITPDGRTGVFACNDGSLQVSDLSEADPRSRTIRQTGAVADLAVSNDGSVGLTVAGESGAMKVWDLRRGIELWSAEHVGGAWSVAITADGRRAVSGGRGSLVFWDLERRIAITTLVTDDSICRAVAISTDGRRATSVSFDDIFSTWDVDQSHPLRSVQFHTSYWSDRSRAHTLALTSPGRWALFASQGSDHDWTGYVCDLDRGVVTSVLPHGHGGRDLAVAITDNGMLAVTASGNGDIKFWDVGTETEPRTVSQQWTFAVTITHEGRQAITVANNGGRNLDLRVWDVRSAGRPRPGHSEAVMAVAMTSDGRRALSASADRTVKLWDLGTGGPLHSFEDSVSGADVAVAQDGRFYATGSHRTVEVFALAGCEQLDPLNYPAGGTPRVTALSPEGRYLAATAYGVVHVWDLQTRSLCSTIALAHQNWVNELAISSEHRLFVAAQKTESIGIYDLLSGQWRGEISTGTRLGVKTLAIAPEGGHLAAACGDEVLVWELTNGEIVSRLLHDSWVDALAFAPGRDVLISTGNDRHLRIWDWASCRELVSFLMDTYSRALAVERDCVLIGDNHGSVICLDYMDRQRR